jgi:hypothetical protein
MHKDSYLGRFPPLYTQSHTAEYQICRLTVVSFNALLIITLISWASVKVIWRKTLKTRK